MSLQGKAGNADVVGLANINLVPFTNSHVPAFRDGPGCVGGKEREEERSGSEGGKRISPLEVKAG